MLNENILNIISSMLTSKDSAPSNTSNYNTSPISNDLKNMYPYGDFPIRYTKNYQAHLKNNLNQVDSFIQNTNTENVDSYIQPNTPQNNFDIKTLLPLIQNLSNNNLDTRSLLSSLMPLIFKDQNNILPLIEALPLAPKKNAPNLSTLNVDREDLDAYILLN
ncbi:MAG: hypothetical protein J6V40_02375 [Clostridia bacterium]|nr:hypothetical protein [Clostridia bacterium]